jgi:hypothetical protein
VAPERPQETEHGPIVTSLEPAAVSTEVSKFNQISELINKEINMSQDTQIEVKKTLKRARQIENLVLAIVQYPSLATAAASIGVSAVTAWRIMKDPEFLVAFRQARSDAVLQANSRMQQACNTAVTTILQIVLDPKASHAIRLRAAEVILNKACAGLAMEEFVERVCQLEEWVTAKNKESQR